MTTYQPKSMLVTGGAGFIGCNFIRHLLANEPDISIINLDKLTYAGNDDNLKNLPNGQHHFIRGDITDKKLVQHVLQHHHIDTIVHFAAESHVDRSISGPQAFVDTNVLGTFVLLDAARYHWFEVDEIKADACRFYHISTDEVYGSLQQDDKPFTEKHPYRPNSPYSASKAASDHLVNAYHATYGLPTIISNCSNNFGPHQHAEKFIPTVILGCINWQPIPIYGQGKNIRDWLYVEDHCKGIMEVLKRGKLGEHYNIGGNNEWENLELARYICKIMDKLHPRHESHLSLLQFVTDRPGHDFRYAIDASKIRKELNWTPQEDFEKGMEKTILYYLNNNKVKR